MDKKRIIGFYNYTVVLTYMGMLFAFTGILDAIRENYIGSILCLMCSGICDMFDGKIARHLKNMTWLTRDIWMPII